MSQSYGNPHPTDLHERQSVHPDREPGLFRQMTGTFSGPMKYWTAFAFVLSLAFFATAIYCALRLADLPDTSEGLLWLAGFCWSVIALGLIKIWFWMRMNQVTLLARLDSLENSIAKLDSRIDAL